MIIIEVLFKTFWMLLIMFIVSTIVALAVYSAVWLLMNSWVARIGFVILNVIYAAYLKFRKIRA